MLFTLLGFIATILGFVYLTEITGYVIHSYTFYAIVPVGGFLVGMAATAAFFFSRKFFQKPIKIKEYIIGALLGIAAYAGIYYASYLTLYISPEGEPNRWFRGEHISNFESEDGKTITFSRYMEAELSEVTHSLSRGRSLRRREFTTGETINVLLLLLQLLGAVVGGALMGLIAGGAVRYCDKCKKYMLEKELFRLHPDEYSKLIELVERKEIGFSLADSIKNLNNASSTDAQYVNVSIEYCPTCHTGHLTIKSMKKNEKSKEEEIPEFTKTVIVANDVTRSLVA